MFLTISCSSVATGRGEEGVKLCADGEGGGKNRVEWAVAGGGRWRKSGGGVNSGGPLRTALQTISISLQNNLS